MYVINHIKAKVPTIYNGCEEITELLSDPNGAMLTSVAHVTLPPKCSNKKHYHPDPVEEIYYMLRGSARIEITDNLGTKNIYVTQGALIFLAPTDQHKITAEEEGAELLVICSPPWKEDIMSYVKE
jgi:quercetin dioxygenase-like cupin family protein